MKRYLFLTMLIFSHGAAFADVGGSTFENLSRTISVLAMPSDKDKKELDEKKTRREALKQKIARQVAEAKAQAEGVLSKDELAKIKAQADAVLEQARRELERLEAEIKSIEDTGAFIFCSSTIIEEEGQK